MRKDYPRDLKGYGEKKPHPKWPENARIAVQFVLNYEEGGENCILHGDEASESFLSEIIGAQPIHGMRHMSMESIYEYGARAGVWRVLDLFRHFEIPITIFAVASAMEKYAAPVERALADGHEICSHGFRWIDYQHVPVEIEAEHIAKTVEIHKRITGKHPQGWYTGRTSPNTRALIVKAGGFLYDADDYSDDIPFWSVVGGKRHLIVPYTLDANDMRFATPQGFRTGGEFSSYLKDSFDTLYEEGTTYPKMMSIGLHARLIGRPGRLAGLKQFIEYIRTYSNVWVARREDIARHWIENFKE